VEGFISYEVLSTVAVYLYGYGLGLDFLAILVSGYRKDHGLSMTPEHDE
jgi:hypothetical protein